MTIPGWYALILLGLGVYRLCRLVGWDDITASLRNRFTLSDEEHSQWTYVMNSLVKLGYDPWDYRYTYRDSGEFIANVGSAQGTHSGNIEVPPLVAMHLFWDNTPRTHERPSQSIVPFTKAEWYVSKLIRCPWCLGFWLSILAWAAWQAWPRGTLTVMSLLALAALPGLITKNLDT